MPVVVVLGLFKTSILKFGAYITAHTFNNDEDNDGKFQIHHYP